MKTNNEKTIRSFIALEPDAPLKRLLKAAVENYQQESWAEQIRWSDVGNWHMTLKFLHNATQAQLDQLTDTLEKRLADQLSPDFELKLKVSSTGTFPSKQSPVAIVAHIENNPQLQLLINVIEETAASCGFKPENRGFKGHITLGRCRDTFNQAKKVENFLLNNVCRVKALFLFKSEVSSHGALYTKLKKFSL